MKGISSFRYWFAEEIDPRDHVCGSPASTSESGCAGKQLSESRAPVRQQPRLGPRWKQHVLKNDHLAPQVGLEPTRHSAARTRPTSQGDALCYCCGGLVDHVGDECPACRRTEVFVGRDLDDQGRPPRSSRPETASAEDSAAGERRGGSGGQGAREWELGGSPLGEVDEAFE